MHEKLPAPDEIRNRYVNGEFQFYPVIGNDQLTTDFFGETFIPKEYILRHYGELLVDFDDQVPWVDQSVVILKSREKNRTRSMEIPSPPQQFMDMVAGAPITAEDHQKLGCILRNFISEQCEIKPTDVILDIGSGCGRIAVSFCRWARRRISRAGRCQTNGRLV